MELNGLTVVMKSPRNCWVWENCRCHYIGLDGLTAVIQSLGLSGSEGIDCCHCILWHWSGLAGLIAYIGYIATDCIWIDRLLSLDTLPSVVSGSWINCSHWILRHWLSLALIGYSGNGHDWIAYSITGSEFPDTS